MLRAAREVFVAQGYHTAGMDDIAVRAGVSKPVLYQHFPGKLELYLALLDQSCDTIIDACREALESTDDNKQRVVATMHVFYDYVANAQGAFRLVFESDLTKAEQVARHAMDTITNVSETAMKAVKGAVAGLAATYTFDAFASGIKGAIESAAELDHIIPIDQAPHLRLMPLNLQPLCHPCHVAKTRRGVGGVV